MKTTYMVRYWDEAHHRQYSFIGRPLGRCEYEEADEEGYPAGVKHWISRDDLIAVSRRGDIRGSRA